LRPLQQPQNATGDKPQIKISSCLREKTDKSKLKELIQLTEGNKEGDSNEQFYKYFPDVEGKSAK